MTNGNPIAYESLDVDGNVCWIAENPSVPGPYAIGDSATEAFEKFEKAMEVWTRLRAEEQAPVLSEFPTHTSGEGIELQSEQSNVFTFRPGSVSVKVTGGIEAIG